MRARSSQTCIIQHLSKLFGRVRSKARGLHLSKSDIVKLLERSRSILWKIIAHRIELNARREAHRICRCKAWKQTGERSDCTRVAGKPNELSSAVNSHSIFLQKICL